MPTHEPTDAQEIETTQAQCQSLYYTMYNSPVTMGSGGHCQIPFYKIKPKTRLNHVVLQH